MAEFRDQTLTGVQTLDDNIYIRCEFINARLVYQGGAAPGFDSCTFEDAEFVFEGAAARTLGFLRGMSSADTNMRDIVLGFLPGLR
ncbi:hypothetical protein [Brevundimonas sp.]|uniref:hypothetical protein n=1 Tax=Brevundimonas sp. TaxID=1871086 RepID=UPI003F72775E